MMRILHTEASPGWGGQEIRILREAEGMRERGHEIIFAINEKGLLIDPLRKAGFLVYPVSFEKSKLLFTFFTILRLIRRHKIDIVNTHSSRDAWFAGLAARVLGRKVVRTRHLSTAIRPGLNSIALYNWLADVVVTTCASIVDVIMKQAKLSSDRCCSIPTGINAEMLQVEKNEGERFRRSLGISEDTVLVGTVCVLRVWKGVADLLKAAKRLESQKNIRFLIVGSGVSEGYFKALWQELELGEKVIFTGHLERPFSAMAALDIFSLLSTGNEGVSQASLQAGYLKKPMVTTETGGLPEVCIDGETGFCVPVQDPDAVAEKILILAKDASLRKEMGEKAHALVKEKFTLKHTLDGMERVYRSVML